MFIQTVSFPSGTTLNLPWHWYFGQRFRHIFDQFNHLGHGNVPSNADELNVTIGQRTLTKGGSITVRLTSYLTSLDLTKQSKVVLHSALANS